MSNGEVCCILGVCCPPVARRDKSIAKIAADTGLTITDASLVFDWFDVRFDFAKKGTLQPLIDHIAASARAHVPEEQ